MDVHCTPQFSPVITGEPSQIETFSLVLSAVGIDHRFNEDRSVLLVAEEDLQSAIFHLTQYRLENLDWPPPPPPPRTIHPHTPHTVLLMALLALFYGYTGPWSTTSRWFVQGAVDGAAILEHGEWWRLATALTLHADLVHLAGNCLLGGGLIHLLGETLGYGLAWLLLVTNGMAGNLLNVVVRQQPHLSLGFSTALFAAIGLFSGHQAGQGRNRSRRALLLPLGAGAGLLAFLGTEGVRADLGAHLFGFASGFSCGLLLDPCGLVERCRRSGLQALLFGLAMAIPLTCWVLALR